jgi:FkbM family methyltransferase
MLSQSPSLRVHAFEPHPTTCALLQDIKTRNHLTRLTPWNIGLGDVVGQLSLQPGTEDSGWSTFGTNPSFESSRIADIAVQPFSLWADQLGLALPDHPAWIAKIDVEGFELKVLRGMEAALKQHAFQGICIEINDYTLKLCGTKSEDIFAFLHTCGYRQVLPHPCGNAFFIPA